MPLVHKLDGYATAHGMYFDDYFERVDAWGLLSMVFSSLSRTKLTKFRYMVEYPDTELLRDFNLHIRAHPKGGTVLMIPIERIKECLTCMARDVDDAEARDTIDEFDYSAVDAFALRMAKKRLHQDMSQLEREYQDDKEDITKRYKKRCGEEWPTGLQESEERTEK